MGHVVGDQAGSPKSQVEELRQQLHEAELAAAVDTQTAEIKNVTGDSEAPKSALGPILTASVEVNGVSTDALVDTGSPATIISLEFAITKRDLSFPPRKHGQRPLRKGLRPRRYPSRVMGVTELTF